MNRVKKYTERRIGRSVNVLKDRKRIQKNDRLERERAHLSRGLAALAGDLGFFQTPQPHVAPAAEEPMPSSGRHRHHCEHGARTYIHTGQIFMHVKSFLFLETGLLRVVLAVL